MLLKNSSFKVEFQKIQLYNGLTIIKEKRKRRLRSLVKSSLSIQNISKQRCPFPLLSGKWDI